MEQDICSGPSFLCLTATGFSLPSLYTDLPARMTRSSTLSPSLHSYLPRHCRLHVHVAVAWAFDQDFKELCTITVAHQQEDCVRLPIRSGTRPLSTGPP